MNPLAFPSDLPFFCRRRLRLFRSRLGDLDDAVHLLDRQATHFGELVGLDHGEVVIGQVALFDQGLSDFFGYPFDLTEAGDRPLDLLFQFPAGHDFDIPAAEFAGESDVLPAASDGQRQLIFLDQDDRPSDHVTQQHLIDLGRLQGIGNQDFWVFAIADDIDVFASQFFADSFDPAAAIAHADGDRVDLCVLAADGHLAAVAGLATDRVDRDHPFTEFGDLLFEQPLHELGTGPTEHHTDAVARCPHLKHDRSHPLVGVQRFAWDLFTTRQNRFDVTKIDRRHTAIGLPDDTADDIADLLPILQQQCVPLGLLDLLNDDLFRGLSPDPSDLVIPQRLSLQGGGDPPILAVELYLDIGVLTVLSLGSCLQRRFDRREDKFLANILLAMQRIDVTEDVLRIHDDRCEQKNSPNLGARAHA